jgi:hypothetical protein
MIDIVALAHQTVNVIGPLLPVIAQHAGNQAADGFLRQPGVKLFDWIASKFKGTAAAAALERAVSDPESQLYIADLRVEIQKLAEQDSEFRERLAHLLEEIASGVGDVDTNQTITQTGDYNKGALASGKDISIQIGD